MPAQKGSRSRDGEREVLARLVHDLRQPLTALRLDLGAALQMLRATAPDTPAVAEVLQDALDDVTAMQQVLDGIQGRWPVVADTPVQPDDLHVSS